jgi:sugar phosphate isomerase/epimerase
VTSSSHSTGTTSEPMVLGHTGRGTPWTIGCSLPTRFIAGEHATNRLELDWVEMYGSADACFVALRDLGVTSIELRDVREGTDPTLVVRALDALRNASMRVSVHLWLPRDARDLRPLVAEIERALPEGSESVPCIVHGHHAETERERTDAMGTTVDGLRVLCRDLHEANSPLEPTLELCRRKPGGPVGTTFDELVTLHDRVAEPNLRLCWDMGHTRSNHVTDGDDLIPRADFLGCVAHTHIHDLGPGGRTHGPLRDLDGPIADQVHTLARTAYRGVFDLELEPGRWSMESAQAREAVEGSVGVLRSILESAPRPRQD